MNILNVLSNNFGKKPRTRQPDDVVPCPEGYRGTLKHDGTLCTGCQSCAYVCSPSAITFDKGDPTFIIWQYNAEQCSFCARCVQYCPTHALSIIPETPVVTGDRSKHHLADKVYYKPCERCGRPIIPIPAPTLAILYQDHLTQEIEELNRLCDKCRSRRTSERIKEAHTGKKAGAK